MLVAYAVAGHRLVPGAGLRWAGTLGVPAVVAVVWGLFVAPRARVPLALPVRVALTTVIFAGAVAALTVAGHPVSAAVLAALFVVDEVALILLGGYSRAKQPARPPFAD